MRLVQRAARLYIRQKSGVLFDVQQKSSHHRIDNERRKTKKRRGRRRRCAFRTSDTFHVFLVFISQRRQLRQHNLN